MIDEVKKALKVFMSDSAAAGITQEIGKTRTTSLLCLAVRLRHFDEMPYKRSAYALADLMNSFYSSVADVVLSTDGDVDNFCGPTVWGFYDEARFQNRQRVLTALYRHLEPAIDLLERRFKVRIAAGICLGRLVYGSFGSSARMTVTGFGEPRSCAGHLADRDSILNVCNSLDISGIDQSKGGQVSIGRHWIPEKEC